MNRGLLKYALLATTGLAVMSVGSAAMAQAPADAASSTVDEVMVTAQKREQNAQDVPVAITALGAQQLQSSGPLSTEDLKSMVPSLNMTTGVAGFGLPRIRGVGASGQGPGIENPVAVMVDGVYYGAASGVLQSLFDTEQVAVLKGPQGTLFGRNATGGVIQITTRRPSYDFHGSAQVGYGNYDTRSAAGFVTGGVSETVALSLSGQYEDRNTGFGVNRFTGKDTQTSETWAGRAKLLWEPTAETSVLLTGHFNGRDAADPTFRNFTLNALGQNLNTLITLAGGDPKYDIYSDINPIFRARQWGASGVIEHDFSAFTVKSITAYADTKLRTYFDPDGTTQPRLRIDNHNFDEQFTQEQNLISNGEGPFKWVVGGFYMWNSAGQDPGRTTGTNTFADNGYSDTITDVGLHSYAGFAEGTYAFNEATNLTAGVRYTKDEREFSARTVTFNGATNVTTNTPSSDARDFSKVTWKLALDHRFSDEVMGYASFNRGFRSGTFVPQATPIIVLEPEIVDAYEVGLKTDLFDRTVRFNVAGFYYDQTNVQVQQVIAGVNSVYNAEGAEIYGVDTDVTWRVTPNLRVFGGIGYAHARYTDFANAIISVPYPLAASYVIPTGQTCRGTFGNARAQLGGNCLVIGDATGNKLQNTPKVTGSVGASWDIRTADSGKFTVAGNYYYNDGFVATADERVAQRAYSTVDGSVTWHSPSDSLYVRVWGKNLGDAFYRTQLSATNSGDNGTPGAPRTFGITVGADF